MSFNPPPRNHRARKFRGTLIEPLEARRIFSVDVPTNFTATASDDLQTVILQWGNEEPMTPNPDGAYLIQRSPVADFSAAFGSDSRGFPIRFTRDFLNRDRPVASTQNVVGVVV